jgi:hypothetical protein
VISTAQAAADAWRSVANSIRSDLERLRADTQNLIDPALRYARGLAQLDRDVLRALSGDIDAAKRVGTSATGFLQAAERTSASRVDYLRDRALTEAKLGAVLDQAEEQASIQQVIADASARQIVELQSINANLVDFARTVLASRGTAFPAFADGGMHAGGLRLVGEHGWEIEATGASRIWNQDQIASALRASGTGDERVWERASVSTTARQSHEQRVEQYLSELVAETRRGNDESRTGDAAIASLVGYLNRQQDRLTEGGYAMRVQVVDDAELQAPSKPRKVQA